MQNPWESIPANRGTEFQRESVACFGKIWEDLTSDEKRQVWEKLVTPIRNVSEGFPDKLKEKDHEIKWKPRISEDGQEFELALAKKDFEYLNRVFLMVDPNMGFSIENNQMVAKNYAGWLAYNLPPEKVGLMLARMQAAVEFLASVSKARGITVERIEKTRKEHQKQLQENGGVTSATRKKKHKTKEEKTEGRQKLTPKQKVIRDHMKMFPKLSEEQIIVKLEKAGILNSDGTLSEDML